MHDIFLWDGGRKKRLHGNSPFLFSADNIELHIGCFVFWYLATLILYCSIKGMFLLFPSHSYTSLPLKEIRPVLSYHSTGWFIDYE